MDLSYRIQSLHVGMQPPGHFSAIVFRISIVEFCRERGRQSTIHFNLHAALKTKLLNFHIHTPSGKTKKKRASYTNKKRELKRKVKNSAAVCVVASNAAPYFLRRGFPRGEGNKAAALEAIFVQLLKFPNISCISAIMTFASL